MAKRTRQATTHVTPIVGGGPSLLGFGVTAGSSYWIRIGGFAASNTGGGSFTINLGP